MAQEFSTPRINSQMRSMFQGKTVMLVGKVTELSGNEALIEASDNGMVKVHRTPDSEMTQNGVVEVLGQVVRGDLSIQEQTSSSLGTTFDLEAYEQMIQIATKFNGLFGWSS